MQPCYAPPRGKALAPLYSGLRVQFSALVNPRIRASIIVSHYPIKRQYKGPTRGNNHSVVKNHEGIPTSLARFQRGKGATHTAPVDANPLIYKAFFVFPHGRLSVGRLIGFARWRRGAAARWVSGALFGGIPRFLPPKKNKVLLYESTT